MDNYWLLNMRAIVKTIIPGAVMMDRPIILQRLNFLYQDVLSWVNIMSLIPLSSVWLTCTNLATWRDEKQFASLRNVNLQNVNQSDDKNLYSLNKYWLLFNRVSVKILEPLWYHQHPAMPLETSAYGSESPRGLTILTMSLKAVDICIILTY